MGSTNGRGLGLVSWAQPSEPLWLWAASGLKEQYPFSITFRVISNQIHFKSKFGSNSLGFSLNFRI
jgi:hypothetical protein